MVWDTDRIAVPLEDVGDAHGSHGNLLLVRNALVQQVHQLILPGVEPRGGHGNGYDDCRAAFAHCERASGVVCGR